MGQESEKKPQLTLNDPVDAATVKRIGELQNRRLQLGDMMIDIEQEKVKILVESRRVDEERKALFHQILTARGLTADVAVEVNPQTGQLSLLRPQGPAQGGTAAEPPAEAVPST